MNRDDVASLHEQLEQAKTRAEAAEAELRGAIAQREIAQTEVETLHRRVQHLLGFGSYARFLVREAGLLDTARPPNAAIGPKPVCPKCGHGLRATVLLAEGVE